MIWNVPNIWEGSEVWILGGGPSLTKQFDIPDSVVNSVISKSASPSVYSPFMEAIHKKHVIGINVAFMVGDWVDMMFFGDSSFLLAYKEQIAKFDGLKVSCHSSVEKYPWIKYVPAERNKKFGISDNKNGVCWNNNSGAAAISLVANMGAKKIILVGFDMHLTQTNAKHWHNEYNSSSSDPNKAADTFDRHLKGFKFIKQDADKRGIEIINACPDSAIKEFPKVTVKELL